MKNAPILLVLAAAIAIAYFQPMSTDSRTRQSEIQAHQQADKAIAQHACDSNPIACANQR